MPTQVWSCQECGSQDVQISLPCWCNPNTLEPVEGGVDAESAGLSTWCNECSEERCLVPSRIPPSREVHQGVTQKYESEGPVVINDNAETSRSRNPDSA